MLIQKKISVIENLEKEDIVQAVIIADNFNNNFSPLLSTSPLALLPLVGVPLINYTLESLAQSGVHETFLFCCSYVDAIRTYLQKSINEKASWSVNMYVHCIMSETCRSLGDALRDLDAKGLIRGYFILMGADTISNVQLLPLIDKLKETCKKDKGAVMSIVYKSAAPGHRAQCSDDSVILAADSNTNQLVYHQKIHSARPQKKSTFSTEIFLEHADVEIHGDLIDPHISICSPSVLPLFADNFDFQTRDDFVKGILMNEEILASTIYWHQLKGDQYAARVSNWKMYQTVSQDVIRRWAFPLVPDMGISNQSQNYMLLRNNVYRNRDVTLAKGCKLEEDVVIAKGCNVRENTKITRSVIGRNCQIGKDCQITDSFIMDGTMIPDGCHIESSVLTDGCNLKPETTIVGRIISSIDETITAAEKLSIDDSKNQAENWDNESIDSEYKNDNLQTGLVKKWWDQDSVDDSSSSDDDTDHVMLPVPDDANLFLQEVVDSLARGYEEKLNCDYLILEINSSRYAYNMALQEVNFFVVKALYNLLSKNVEDSSKSPLVVLAAFGDLLTYFKPIVVNYIKGHDAMMDCLKATEESCNEFPVLTVIVTKVVHHLYEKDIVSEDAILKWYSDMKKENSPLCSQAGLIKLIDWLQEASEESEDSD